MIKISDVVVSIKIVQVGPKGLSGKKWKKLLTNNSSYDMSMIKNATIYVDSEEDSPKIQEPDSEEVFDQWNIPVLRLPKEAAEFYVLEFLVGVEEFAPAAPLLDAKVKFLSEAFSNYLNMAIGGEFRHVYRHLNQSWKNTNPGLRRIYPEPSEFEGKGIKTIPRSAAWERWKGLYERDGIAALEIVMRCFKNETPDAQWLGSFGGLAWGRITELLLRFLTNKISPKIFVDQVWSIQHNGGTIFDKASTRLLGLGVLREVLNAQAAGSISSLLVICGPEVRRVYHDWVEKDKVSEWEVGDVK